MLRLKKVKKLDNEVTAEFYIESSSECGHIVIDINIMDIKEYSMPSGWETDFINQFFYFIEPGVFFVYQ